MNRVVRAVVTSLLLLALPVQGFAAGTMLFCGAGAGTSASAGHHHDGAAGDEAHGHSQDAGTVSTDGAGAPTLHDVMHGKCSVCSSCCSAAALPTASIQTAAATPHAAPLLDLHYANPGRKPARLERPPRSNLA
jgi:hypothetical protein